MVKLGGFDTHNNQNQASGDIQGKHSELMTELSGAIESFMSDLNADNLADDVLGVTFSEFGRKAKENGSLFQRQRSHNILPEFTVPYHIVCMWTGDMLLDHSVS